MKYWIILGVSTLFFSAHAQNTVGLTDYQSANLNGYVLFSPIVSTDTYLIDKCGEKVHEWTNSSYKPALSAFLLEDGSLLRTGQLNNPNFNEGGSGGIIERFDWNGNLTWNYSISDTVNCLHHDVRPMPNGNLLCIVWDRYTKQQAIANGKDSLYSNAFLWSEKIVELQPIGSNNAVIVWEWKLWDHLVQDYDGSKPNFGNVSTSPELINLNNFPGAANTPDWIHLNSIDYNSELDQILLSSHTFSEVWVIDHSTSTQEAASHSGGNAGMGGDILYRWGNPQAYQQGNPSTKKFYGQHHATWIPQGFPYEGKIIVFNNGLNRPGTFSSVDLIDPPLTPSNTYSWTPASAYLPNDLFWSYTAPTPSDFYSSNISGVYPLSNGSFLITSGTKGLFFEIDSAKQIQWSYTNPVMISGIATQGTTATNNLVFRCNFYPVDYAGISGQNLTPLGEIELNPSSPSLCSIMANTTEQELTCSNISIYPNPVSSILNIDVDNSMDFSFQMVDMTGRMVLEGQNNPQIDCSFLDEGSYFLTIVTRNNDVQSFKLVK